MSFYFWILALLLLAVACVLIPYFRATRMRQQTARLDTNLALYKARIKELENEQAQGLIDASELHQLSDELGLSLLTDTRQPEQAASVPADVHADDAIEDQGNEGQAQSHIKYALFGALALCAFSWLLYLSLGAWPDVEIQQASKVLESEEDNVQAINELVKLLTARLADKPEASSAWYLLGHAHMKRGTYSQSVEAFTRLRSLTPGDVSVETSLVQAQYLADEGRISAATRADMQAILKRSPHQPIILEILAIDAFQKQDAQAAITYIEQALAGGIRGARAESFRNGLVRAQEMLGSAPTPDSDNALDSSASGSSQVNLPKTPDAIAGRVVLKVSIDPAIEASPDTPVFVIAREQGGMPMPLAVKRLQVADLPAEVVLSDADAMMPNRLISQFELIELIARLSLSGQPALQPGDMETRKSNVLVEQLKKPIVLRLEP